MRLYINRLETDGDVRHVDDPRNHGKSILVQETKSDASQLLFDE